MRLDSDQYLGPWGGIDSRIPGSVHDWSADLWASCLPGTLCTEYQCAHAVTSLHYSQMADHERLLEVAAEIPLEIAA